MIAVAEFRQRVRFTLEACRQSLSRNHRVWMLAGIVAAIPLLLHPFVTVNINATESLPQAMFIIVKGAAVHKGDYVAFRWHGGGPYKAGETFVKILAGVPGDLVENRNRRFYVNGVDMGLAKTVSRAGVPLEPGPTGILPANNFYVMTPHRDSLDSRYALSGWLRSDEIIGRAYALF